MREQEDKFFRNVRQVLDQSVADLDPALMQKLSKVKYQVLEAQPAAPRRTGFWAAGLSAILLLLVMLNLPGHKKATGPDFLVLEVVAGDMTLDFFQHDMEFYLWLSEVMHHENNPSGGDVERRSDVDAVHASNGRGAAARQAVAKSGIDRVFGRVQG